MNLNDNVYKSISFRLNLNDEADQELYQRILDEATNYSSVSAYVRIVFDKYFKELDKSIEMTAAISTYERMEILLKQHTESMQKLINDNIQAQGMKLVGALLSGLQGFSIPDSSYQSIANSPDILLPEEADELPDQMSGVLEFLK